MSLADYIAYNGPMVTTAAFAPVTTGTAIKTLLQLKAGANDPLRIWKWGVSFDGTGTTPIKVELVHTGTVAATVTAHAAVDIQPLGVDQSASAVTVGSTTGSGYTATAEGTITATRYGDVQQILPGNFFQNEFSLGREFYVPAAGIVRVRVTATAAVNATCWVCWTD